MSVEMNFEPPTRRIFYDTDNVLRFQNFVGEYENEAAITAALAAGTAVCEDASTWSISFSVRKKSRGPLLIYKESADGIAVTGTFDADPVDNEQRIEVTIEDTDIYDPSASPPVDVKGGNYIYALKRIDPGFERILAFGVWVIPETAAHE